MEAAKRKTFWLLWIASAILLSLPALASGVDVSHLKTHAELSCENGQFSTGPWTLNPVNATRYYDWFREAASDSSVAPKGPMTPDQRALKELVDEATLGGRKPLTVDQADTVLDWADEVGYPGVRAKPGDVGNPSNWPSGGGQPHIHFPGVGSGHIPVQPGVKPR